MSLEAEDTGAPEARDYEAEALKMGWRPLEEFNGDPAKHKSAEDFVKAGEEKLPLALKRIDSLKKALDTAERRSAQRDKDFDTVKAMMSTMEKRAYERALSDLKEKQDAAYEAQDIDRYKAIGDRIEKLREEAAPEEKPKPQTKYEPHQIQRLYADFVADNDWFDEGATGGPKKAMTVYAGTVADELGLIDDYNGSPEDYFKALADRVKERFADRYPEMFGLKKSDDEHEDPKPRRKSAVEPVSNGRGKPGPKTAASLTPEQRAQGDRFVNMGIFPDLNAYAKELFANG